MIIIYQICVPFACWRFSDISFHPPPPSYPFPLRPFHYPPLPLPSSTFLTSLPAVAPGNAMNFRHTLQWPGKKKYIQPVTAPRANSSTNTGFSRSCTLREGLKASWERRGNTLIISIMFQYPPLCNFGFGRCLLDDWIWHESTPPPPPPKKKKKFLFFNES